MNATGVKYLFCTELAREVVAETRITYYEK